MNSAARPGRFEKYDRGAYHWVKLAGRGRHFHARLHARYGWFLKNAGSGTVVDVGCGDGALAALFAGKGRAVVGIEPDAKAIALAKTMAPRVDFRVGDAGAIPHADVVVLCEVIEHLADPSAALRAARAAAPRILISTPQAQHELADPLHVREFTAAELRTLLSEHYEHVEIWVTEPDWLLRSYSRSRLVRAAVNSFAAHGLNVFSVRSRARPSWRQLYAIGTAPGRADSTSSL